MYTSKQTQNTIIHQFDNSTNNQINKSIIDIFKTRTKQSLKSRNTAMNSWGPAQGAWRVVRRGPWKGLEG